MFFLSIRLSFLLVGAGRMSGRCAARKAFLMPLNYAGREKRRYVLFVILYWKRSQHGSLVLMSKICIANLINLESLHRESNKTAGYHRHIAHFCKKGFQNTKKFLCEKNYSFLIKFSKFSGKITLNNNLGAKYTSQTPIDFDWFIITHINVPQLLWKKIDSPINFHLIKTILEQSMDKSKRVKKIPHFHKHRIIKKMHLHSFVYARVKSKNL